MNGNAVQLNLPRRLALDLGDPLSARPAPLHTLRVERRRDQRIHAVITTFLRSGPMPASKARCRTLHPGWLNFQQHIPRLSWRSAP